MILLFCRGELVSLADIENIHKKRRHDKEMRQECVKVNKLSVHRPVCSLRSVINRTGYKIYANMYYLTIISRNFFGIHSVCCPVCRISFPVIKAGGVSSWSFNFILISSTVEVNVMNQFALWP